MAFLARALEWQRTFSNQMSFDDPGGARYQDAMPGAAAALNVPRQLVEEDAATVATAEKPEQLACQELQRATAHLRATPRERTLARATVEVVARLCRRQASAMDKLQGRGRDDPLLAARLVERSFKPSLQKQRATMAFGSSMDEPAALVRALAHQFAKVQRPHGRAQMHPCLLAPGCPEEKESAYFIDVEAFFRRWQQTPELAAVVVAAEKSVSILYLSGLHDELYVAHRDMKPSDRVQYCVATLNSTSELSFVVQHKTSDDVRRMLATNQAGVTSWLRGAVAVFYSTMTIGGVLAAWDEPLLAAKRQAHAQWTRRANKKEKRRNPLPDNLPSRLPGLLPLGGKLRKFAAHEQAGFAVYGWALLGRTCKLMMASAQESVFQTWPAYYVYAWKCMQTETPPLVRTAVKRAAKKAAVSVVKEADKSVAEDPLAAASLQESPATRNAAVARPYQIPSKYAADIDPAEVSEQDLFGSDQEDERPPKEVPRAAMAANEVQEAAAEAAQVQLQSFLQELVTALAASVEHLAETHTECKPSEIEKKLVSLVTAMIRKRSNICYASYEAALRWLAYVVVGRKLGLQLQAARMSAMVSRIDATVARYGREAAAKQAADAKKNKQPGKSRKQSKKASNESQEGKTAKRPKKAAPTKSHSVATEEAADVEEEAGTVTSHEKAVPTKPAGKPHKQPDVKRLPEAQSTVAVAALASLRDTATAIVQHYENSLDEDELTKSLSKLVDELSDDVRERHKTIRQFKLVFHPDKHSEDRKAAATVAFEKLIELLENQAKSVKRSDGSDANVDLAFLHELFQKKRMSRRTLQRAQGTQMRARNKMVSHARDADMIAAGVAAMLRYLAMELTAWQWTHPTEREQFDHSTAINDVDTLVFQTTLTKYPRLIQDAHLHGVVHGQNERVLRGLEYKESLMNKNDEGTDHKTRILEKLYDSIIANRRKRNVPERPNVNEHSDRATAVAEKQATGTTADEAKKMSKTISDAAKFIAVPSDEIKKKKKGKANDNSEDKKKAATNAANLLTKTRLNQLSSAEIKLAKAARAEAARAQQRAERQPTDVELTAILECLQKLVPGRFDEASLNEALRTNNELFVALQKSCNPSTIKTAAAHMPLWVHDELEHHMVGGGSDSEDD